LGLVGASDPSHFGLAAPSGPRLLDSISRSKALGFGV